MALSCGTRVVLLLLGATTAAGRHKATVDSSCKRRLLFETKQHTSDDVQLLNVGRKVDGTSKRSGGRNSNHTSVRLSSVGSLLEWHFSFSGVPGSAFEGGIYHGRFLIPREFPRMAPRVQMLTPNGRFKTFTDICLSASSFHPESW